MAKKLTKKQLKEIEEKERSFRMKRRKFVESIKNYWYDVKAVSKYYEINNIKEKLNQYNTLKDLNEAQKLLDRYDILKQFKLKSEYDAEDKERHTWSIIRFIINTEDHKKGYEKVIYNDSRFEKEMLEDDIYVEDILWGENDVDLLIKYMKELGYKRIQYFCHSSGVNEDLYYFVNKGCKITDVNSVLRKRFGSEDFEVYKTGLIIELGENNNE